MMRTVTAHRPVRPSWRPSARDLRLIISVTLLGGAMGVAVRLVSILAATKSWLDPEHLPLGQAAFLGGAGLVSGCIVRRWSRTVQCGHRRHTRAVHRLHGRRDFRGQRMDSRPGPPFAILFGFLVRVAVLGGCPVRPDCLDIPIRTARYARQAGLSPAALPRRIQNLNTARTVVPAPESRPDFIVPAGSD